MSQTPLPRRGSSICEAARDKLLPAMARKCGHPGDLAAMADMAHRFNWMAPRWAMTTTIRDGVQRHARHTNASGTNCIPAHNAVPAFARLALAAMLRLH